MKIVNIIGGLGNQMFQYAFGKELEHRTNESVFYNTSWFEKYPLHNGFELERLFTCEILLAPQKSVNKLSTPPDSLLNRLRRKYITKKSHHIDRFFSYNEAVFDLSGDVFFDGFWQSDLYFNYVASKIVNDFTFKLPLNQKNKDIINFLKQKVSASIHARRGDYLKSQNLAVCTPQYFKNAIAKLQQSNTQAIEHFLIFSDDIEWCMHNIETNGIEKTFVDWNTGSESWQDMALMSHCSHNIIANSSFSWWAAYLNKNTKKKIIAPTPWNMRELAKTDRYYNYDFNTVVPKNWIRVPIENVNQ